MDPIRIGVVGGGYWGKKVIREIQAISGRTDGIKLQSVVDNSPTMLAQCQDEFGPLDYKLDYQSLLPDPDLTAVHICTPNATHYEVASAFLKHGVHVMVEKPLTLQSKQAFELVRLARDNEAVLCVGHIHRFNNGVRELKQALASSVLGELYYLRLNWTGFLPPQSQRDVITDLGPHPFDVCNYLTNKWPVKITCRARGYRTGDNVEVAFITAEYEGGLTAHVEVSWLDHEKRRDVTVVAGRGGAYLDCAKQEAFVRSQGNVQQIPIQPSNTLGTEILHFIDCIVHREDAGFANLSDGILGARVVRVLEAAKESLVQERTVPIEVLLAEEIPAS